MTDSDDEKVELQKDMARAGLDRARGMIMRFYAPAPGAVELLEKGEQCFAKGEYTRALEFAILCGDELDRISGRPIDNGHS